MNRIRFDAAVIDFPILTADPVTVQLARMQCERELDALGFGVRIADRARRLIADGDGDFGMLQPTAARLGLSPRTFRRRLAAEGVSFSALVEQGRREKALRLLRAPRFSIEDIARRLGYATSSSFVRAFHRVDGDDTGSIPADDRRSLTTRLSHEA
jgi:AraC-like DNA-binding protein